MKKPFFKKRPYKKRVVRKPRYARPVSTAVKQYVNKAIHKNIEDKTAVYVTNIMNVNAYTFNTLMGVVTCIPSINISQGTGQSNRIGNTIRTRSLNVKFCFYPNPYNATDNAVPKPQEVLLFFGKLKGQKDRVPITSDFQKLWQNGSSSTQPYSDLRDLTQMVNTDYWIVYKIMRFKIGTAAYGGTGSQAGAQFFENNDFKLNAVRTVNLTKFCPKVLKFNDTTLSPSNDNLYMWHTCVNADGSAASSTYPMTMSYSFNYIYEDA